jgi:phospholipid/cholesterol/gamma-HCH transport system substrate-binding protein
MENKAHALAAGVFALVLCAALVALAVWLTRESEIRQPYEVSTRDPVTGLQPQASVRFRGINVGKVAAIGFDRKIPGNVLVRLNVDVGTPITRSTFATLGFIGVTGIAYVQLDDTGESKEMLTTSSAQPARIPMRPGLMGQLTEQGTHILKELEETSRRVNQLLAPENQLKLVAGLEALQQAAASVPPVMKEAGATFQSFRETSGDVASSAAEVKKTAAELNLLSQRVLQPGGLLDQLTLGATALAASSQALQTDTLPRINRTVDEARRSVQQMGRASAQLKDNPQVLLFGGERPEPGPGEPGFAVPGNKP